MKETASNGTAWIGGKAVAARAPRTAATAKRGHPEMSPDASRAPSMHIHFGIRLSACEYLLHPVVGTFLARWRIPLHKWRYAMFLFPTSRH
ncbi:MAG: hypothetical protein OXC41_02115 [Gammaproteobacteria bacterium]|nr:hypothetical protein [Gammaproteobacteria bacterium]